MATWFTICVLRSPQGLPRYEKELQSLILHRKEHRSHMMAFDMLSLKKNQYVQGIWKEALRTGSASAAARVVTRDSEIEGYMVQKGSVIMIPMHLLHFDHGIFPNPEKIDPMRWITGQADSNVDEKDLQTRNANLRSFGGGTGLCSGRFVAEQEIVSVVSTVLLLFDLDFVIPVEQFELNPRSIGIMSPKIDPLVRMRRRDLAS
jgi:cytochrome P450